MARWKLLRLSAARLPVILVREKEKEVVVDQATVMTWKLRGRRLELIVKLQECDYVILNENSINAAELVVLMIDNLSGLVSYT